MKKLILFIIVLAAITEGCKKYEDGPLISLRSVKNRLYGDYTLTKYTVNGVDSLSLYNDSLDLIIHSHPHQDDSNIYFVFSGKNESSTGFVMICILINKNKILKALGTSGLPIGTGPFGKDKKPEWEILRLTNKELNMKTTYNGKEYYVELVEK